MSSLLDRLAAATAAVGASEMGGARVRISADDARALLDLFGECAAVETKPRVILYHEYDVDSDPEVRVVQNVLRASVNGESPDIFADAADSDVDGVTFAEIAEWIVSCTREVEVLRAQAKHAVDAATARARMKALLYPYARDDEEERFNEGVEECIDIVRDMRREVKA